MDDDEIKALLRQILEFLPTLATKAELKQVIDILPTLATKADLAAVELRLDARIDSIAMDVAVLKSDVAVLKVGQTQILQHLDVAELKGRIEEQSRTIASLIPTSIAAVAGR